jgi:hypothetical protein
VLQNVWESSSSSSSSGEFEHCVRADRCPPSLPPFLQAINPGGWTRTQEVSNGRAAIAGLIAAFIAEKSVHTSAFDQLFGSAGGAPWAKPLFFVVVGTFIAITGAGELINLLYVKTTASYVYMCHCCIKPDVFVLVQCCADKSCL